MSARLAWLSALVAVAGCGKPLVGDDYRGAPFWSVSADLSRGGTLDADAQYRVALFFSPALATVDPTEMRELAGSTTPATAPSNVIVNVYALPTADDLVAGSDYGVGRLFVYDDADRDGRYDAGDSFVGVDPPAAFVWAARDLAAGETPGHGALTAGFHRVLEPQPCAFVPPPTTPGDCGVPLGNHCDVDSECGSGGLCLKETKMPWPAGYCVVPEPPTAGCRPGDGALLWAPQYSLTPPGLVGFWGRACASDDDCVRPQDRDAGLYGCDPGLGACVPAAPPLIPVGSPVEVEPFCAGMTRSPPPPTM